MFGKKSEKEKVKEITLEDVVPLHPNEYPAKHLKERLDMHHEHIQEAGHNLSHSPGISGPA
jgi:hypothetical protein